MNALATLDAPLTALLARAKYHHARMESCEASARINNPVGRVHDEDEAFYHFGNRDHALKELQAFGVTIPGFAPYTKQHRPELVAAFLKE